MFLSCLVCLQIQQVYFVSSVNCVKCTNIKSNSSSGGPHGPWLNVDSERGQLLASLLVNIALELHSVVHTPQHC